MLLIKFNCFYLSRIKIKPWRKSILSFMCSCNNEVVRCSVGLAVYVNLGGSLLLTGKLYWLMALMSAALVIPKWKCKCDVQTTWQYSHDLWRHESKWQLILHTREFRQTCRAHSDTGKWVMDAFLTSASFMYNKYTTVWRDRGHTFCVRMRLPISGYQWHLVLEIHAGIVVLYWPSTKLRCFLLQRLLYV
jgi:hypothetical protein